MASRVSKTVILERLQWSLEHEFTQVLLAEGVGANFHYAMIAQLELLQILQRVERLEKVLLPIIG